MKNTAFFSVENTDDIRKQVVNHCQHVSRAEAVQQMFNKIYAHIAGNKSAIFAPNMGTM